MTDLFLGAFAEELRKKLLTASRVSVCVHVEQLYRYWTDFREFGGFY